MVANSKFIVADGQADPVRCGHLLSAVDDDQKLIDIETLARMAARLAGRDPDQHVEVRLGKDVAFNDAAWRYPDFLKRAAAAYKLLHNGVEF
jgi:hypothetical protein